MCDLDSNGIEMGFQGGIREFIARNEFETEETIDENKNRI